MFFMSLSILSGLTVFAQPNSPSYLKIFPFFLLLTLINELIAGYLINQGEYTTELYNFYNIVHFGFYIFLLSKILKSPYVQKIVLYILIGYLFFSIANLLFFQTIHTYNSITYALGCLLVVSFCIYYFFELFRQKYIVRLTREPSFWIVTGLLFYFTCSFPLLASINFMAKVPEIIINNLQTLIQLMNILLYSLYTVAFLCRIKIPKYTLS